MIDQVASADTCQVCGALLSKDQFQVDGLCGGCAASTAGTSIVPPSPQESSLPYGFAPEVQQDLPPDPDNPSWGPASGVGVWVASVIAIIIVPIIAVMAWLVIQKIRGAPLGVAYTYRNQTVVAQVADVVVGAGAVDNRGPRDHHCDLLAGRNQERQTAVLGKPWLELGRPLCLVLAGLLGMCNRFASFGNSATSARVAAVGREFFHRIA